MIFYFSSQSIYLLLHKLWVYVKLQWLIYLQMFPLYWTLFLNGCLDQPTYGFNPNTLHNTLDGFISSWTKNFWPKSSLTWLEHIWPASFFHELTPNTLDLNLTFSRQHIGMNTFGWLHFFMNWLEMAHWTGLKCRTGLNHKMTGVMVKLEGTLRWLNWQRYTSINRFGAGTLLAEGNLLWLCFLFQKQPTWVQEICVCQDSDCWRKSSRFVATFKIKVLKNWVTELDWRTFDWRRWLTTKTDKRLTDDED